MVGKNYHSLFVDENPLHLTNKSRLARFKKACKGMYLESRVDYGDYVEYRYGSSFSYKPELEKATINVSSIYKIRKDSPLYQDIDLVLSTLETL